jgi:undecaprenyl-diphosphatase
MSNSRIIVSRGARRVACRAGRVGQRLKQSRTAYFSALVVFAALAVLAHIYAYFSWDLVVAHVLQDLHVPGLLVFMRGVSILGKEGASYLLVAATMTVFLLLRWYVEVAALLLSTEGSRIMYHLLKVLVERPRPARDLLTVFEPFAGWSFPSGHVMFYVGYFGFLYFVTGEMLPRGSILGRVIRVAAVLAIILIGLSRVYLGAHWPSDVLGAYLAGGLWLALSIYVYRVCKSDERNRAGASKARLTPTTSQ